jgi:hypothetical protein
MLVRSIAVGFLLTGCTPNVVIESDGDANNGTAVSIEGDEPGECSDGADNDGDGYFDCDDNECWNSPDCDETGGTGNGGGGNGNGNGGGGAGTSTSTSTTDGCEPFCGITSVELTYRMVMDWDTVIGGLLDCGSEFGGSGEFHSVDGNYLTFAGNWGAVDDGCFETTGQEFVRDWSGGAFHTFYFTSDTEFVLDWFAHRDLDEADTDGDPVFFWTELDLEFDITAPEFELYILQEEPLTDKAGIATLGTLYQEFRATFRR